MPQHRGQKEKKRGRERPEEKCVKKAGAQTLSRARAAVFFFALSHRAYRCQMNAGSGQRYRKAVYAADERQKPHGFRAGASGQVDLKGHANRPHEKGNRSQQKRVQEKFPFVFHNFTSGKFIPHSSFLYTDCSLQI